MTRATDIEQRASLWMIRSESGHFTDEMRSELERWLDADPRNRISYFRMKEAWRRADHIRNARPLEGNADADLFEADDPNNDGPGTDTDAGVDRSGGSRWSFRVATQAALAVVVCFLGIILWIVYAPSDWATYSTSIGGYEQIALPDGTDIQLNTDSEIKTRVTRDRREIKVVRGEALVKVASDATRAFTVKAGGTAVLVEPSRTLSATFNVRVRSARSVDVSVTRGNVLVGSAPRFADAVLGRGTEFDSELASGDTAAFRPEGVRFSRVGLDELNRKLSWTAGLLSFRGETLAEVVEEFNRYNRQQLVVADPSIANRRLGGAFQATDPRSFVLDLEKFDVRADEQVGPISGNSTIRLRGIKRPH